MAIDPTAANVPLVVQDDDRPVEGRHDERGHLTWRTLFSADATPSDTLVAGLLRVFYVLAADDLADVEYTFS